MLTEHLYTFRWVRTSGETLIFVYEIFIAIYGIVIAKNSARSHEEKFDR